uniref:Uncharacterized protein n=1 Tax=Rousettus aegyptiacus TaxID=9407 RepID=A0A7J8KA31_ROUAE|nr:hypothetical protein HJG63_007223 [Rousettus aegyptiacus]
MTHFPNHLESQGGVGGNGGARCLDCLSTCRRNSACGMSGRPQVLLGLLVHGMLYEFPQWTAARRAWPREQGSGYPCRCWRQRQRLGPKQRPCP